jgi:hypothetical protein
MDCLAISDAILIFIVAVFYNSPFPAPKGHFTLRLIIQNLNGITKDSEVM